MKKSWSIYLVLLLLVFSANIFPENLENLKSAQILDKYLTRMAGFGFSGAVIVEKEDRLLLRKGYGFANRKKEIPFTPDTPYPVQSISKQFTATSILKLEEQGKELITGIHKPDDFFGFTSFTKNIPYPEYATAMEDTRCIGIAKNTMKEVLLENPDLVMELMQLMAESLSDARDQLLQMAYGSVRKKTANTILRFADKLQSNASGPIHILRSDLAGVAGMATETLIRTLSSFKKEGLIDICDRDIQILDEERLRNIN